MVEHSAVHPFGQSFAHVVVPWELTVEFAPTTVLASELPLKVTLPSAPGSIVHVDPGTVRR